MKWFAVFHRRDARPLTDAELRRVLAISRTADDDTLVQCGTVVNYEDGVATVQRYGWHGERLPDYLVKLDRGTAAVNGD